MLTLTRLEVEGFGPFAEKQTIDIAPSGVTVVYGENMRGKTSLLNAVRYAFFGVVLGRGSRARRLHTVSNRERAARGEYGFSVSLRFLYDGVPFELVRSCLPSGSTPLGDGDYEQTVLLKRDGHVLGPQERDRALEQVFPKEISRFFLFDGELLQEYEELLINESDAGRHISGAIERILGVPILKRGLAHLTQMSQEADKASAREASRHQETEALGNALQQATEQREAHQGELNRLRLQLEDLGVARAEAEQTLQSIQKYAAILQERDDASKRLRMAAAEESDAIDVLRRVMSSSWRALLREPVREARLSAQRQADIAVRSFVEAIRSRSVQIGRCETCEQEIVGAAHSALSAGLPPYHSDNAEDLLGKAMSRLSSLGMFEVSDVVGECRMLWKRIVDLRIEQVTLRDRVADLNGALSESDPDFVRRSRASYAEILEKTTVVKRGIDDEGRRVFELDQNIQRIKKKLDSAGPIDLRISQARSNILRDSAEVFAASVERYKHELRSRVERTASDLFLAMTTERDDYAGLSINDGYGLTIRHKDGRIEEARSAGAEHIVALALMGSLQNNAPLKGPIVMDSPFGRLDEQHTANVISTLPVMAGQVILLVYESEVGKSRVRELLAQGLKREYELQRLSSRRTNIREVS